VRTGVVAGASTDPKYMVYAATTPRMVAQPQAAFWPHALVEPAGRLREVHFTGPSAVDAPWHLRSDYVFRIAQRGRIREAVPGARAARDTRAAAALGLRGLTGAVGAGDADALRTHAPRARHWSHARRRGARSAGGAYHVGWADAGRAARLRAAEATPRVAAPWRGRRRQCGACGADPLTSLLSILSASPGSNTAARRAGSQLAAKTTNEERGNGRLARRDP